MMRILAYFSILKKTFASSNENGILIRIDAFSVGMDQIWCRQSLIKTLKI